MTDTDMTDDDIEGCPECGEAWSSEEGWRQHRCGTDRGDVTPPQATQQSSPNREER